jgi:hypothetical protein
MPFDSVHTILTAAFVRLAGVAIRSVDIGQRRPGGGEGGAVRTRFWIEAALSVVAAGALVLTLFVPDWIELVFQVDPDDHSGFLEWMIGVGALVTLGASLLARSEFRRYQALRAGGSAGPTR